MSSLLACPHGRFWLRATLHPWTSLSSRDASTTSAIKRGLRAEQDASRPVRSLKRDQRPRRREEQPRRREQQPWRREEQPRQREQQPWRRPSDGRQSGQHVQQKRTRPRDSPPAAEVGKTIEQWQNTDGPRREPQERRPSRPSDVPISVPRTTAASVYIYGYNSVIAAVKAKRRKLYTLFTSARGLDFRTARALTDALPKDVVWKKSASPALLDAMSDGRPHNGVCLEASPLPAPPVLGLDLPHPSTGDIPLDLAHQNAEEAAINGTSTTLPSSSKTWRRPLVLMLDGILDPQNVGNILRTAHFYGVDAVAISTNTCCPLTSPALAKASSGACEAVPIFALPKPSSFVYASQKAGWKVYAAMPEVRNSQKSQVSHVDLSRDSPLSRDPTILMLGAEGEGLRENLKQKADFFVNISRPQGVAGGKAIDVGVDSINVGTAAAVLIDSFLRKPVQTPPPVVGNKPETLENNRLF